jgi:predicted nucleotidyltransferase
MFGLKVEHIVSINRCFAQYAGIEQVVVYGSRAKGNYKNGSDVDLTVIGNLDYSGLLKLENQLDDLLLPYKIDISLHHQINDPDLLKHIQRVGKVFYQKEKPTQRVAEPISEYKPSNQDLPSVKNFKKKT